MADFFKQVRVCLCWSRHSQSGYESSILASSWKEIGKIAEARIKQIMNQDGKQIQKIAPQIISGVIQHVYKTPFRLLGNFVKK